MRDHTNTRILLGAAAIIATAGLATPSFGQNALGTGTALDRSLQQGVRINRPTSDFYAELAFRNAIVTGNAPGGMAFRGDVGYRAPGDFTGGSEIPFNLRNRGLGADAGSNDLFNFQRDSIYSGLAARGVRGVDALRYQMQLTTGSSTGELPVLPIIRRATAPDTSMYLDSRIEPGQIQSLDAYSIAPGTLRSTSEFLSNAFLDPSLLRMQESDNGGALGRDFTIATPLLGVAIQPAPTFTTDMLTTDSLIPKTPTETLNELRSPNQVSHFIEPPRPVSSYREILRQLNSYESANGPDTPLRKPDDQLNPLTGAANSDPLTGTNLVPPRDAGAQAIPTPTLEERLSQLRQAMVRTPVTRDPQSQRLRDEIDRTIEVLRGAAPRVETFAPDTNEERDLFAEHMHRGERLLGEGRWFDAEEHFASALSMRPGDTLAAAGRVHAEIGAGLFLSAALNLQKLILENPGLISVRYEPELLPSQERLDQIISRLRVNAAQDSPSARNSALLLAYLGYQLDRPLMIEEGFSAIDRITTALEEAPNPLYDITRKVWMP